MAKKVNQLQHPNKPLGCCNFQIESVMHISDVMMITVYKYQNKTLRNL